MKFRRLLMKFRRLLMKISKLLTRSPRYGISHVTFFAEIPEKTNENGRNSSLPIKMTLARLCLASFCCSRSHINSPLSILLRTMACSVACARVGGSCRLRVVAWLLVVACPALVSPLKLIGCWLSVGCWLSLCSLVWTPEAVALPVSAAWVAGLVAVCVGCGAALNL